MKFTRRHFLKTTAVALGMPTFIPASALGRDGAVAPSNRIVVGGIGVLALNSAGLANYHIKAANLLGVVLGGGVFGVGMVVLGYCPGTAIAAAAGGSVHALAGLAGALLGGVLYAFSFPWISAKILPIGALGKVRLPDVTGVPAWVWFAGLAIGAVVIFRLIERHERSSSS